ncbi:MAG: YraN family protein [Bacteroidia bacterium]|nr:YraN family protein [Bacteroidia bacterium]
MAAHNDTGRRGEDLAAELLSAKGYNVLDRNYRFENAEVDLVALRLEPAELVFVEVKTRTTPSGHYPEESVTPAKQQLIFKAADCYLYEKRLFTVPVRFDIIAVHLHDPAEPVFHHIEDAFRMTR